jgi:hypothetical protein
MVVAALGIEALAVVLQSHLSVAQDHQAGDICSLDVVRERVGLPIHLIRDLIDGPGVPLVDSRSHRAGKNLVRMYRLPVREQVGPLVHHGKPIPEPGVFSFPLRCFLRSSDLLRLLGLDGQGTNSDDNSQSLAERLMSHQG